MPPEPSFVALSDDDFLREATAIVAAAKAAGTELRILGSLAIYAHSVHVPESIAVFRRLGRVAQGKPLFTDLDLMGYARQGRSISNVLAQLGFKSDDMINGLFGDRRLVYYEKADKFHIDIFLDKLEFSHTVEFGRRPGEGRLELDYPTITLTDIVLEKLQIHKIGRKDLVDLIILLLGHDVSATADGNREAVDAKYIADLVADDWGFWYESTQNLGKTRQMLATFVSAGQVQPDQSRLVDSRIAALEAALAAVPKGRHWTKRSKVGTAKPWYRDVEEIVR